MPIIRQLLPSAGCVEVYTNLQLFSLACTFHKNTSFILVSSDRSSLQCQAPHTTSLLFHSVQCYSSANTVPQEHYYTASLQLKAIHTTHTAHSTNETECIFCAIQCSLMLPNATLQHNAIKSHCTTVGNLMQLSGT